MAAMLTFESVTYLIAFMTRAAFLVTDDHFLTDIGFPTVIPVNAEIVRVVEAALVPGILNSVKSDFLGNGCRIFTQISGDILERASIIQGVLNKQTVIEGQMFLVAWYES